MTRSDAISRRSFVQGAALAGAGAAAMGAAGMSAAKARAAEAEGAEMSWDAEADVVVCGLGGAGAAAAIEADAAGASVLVIEKATRGGGCTYRCGGLIYMGGGTALQKELGVEDTPEAMLAYVTASAGPSADAELVKVYCDASVGLYDWCVEQGMEFGGGLDAERHLVTAEAGLSLTYSGNERAEEYAATIPPAPRGHTPTTFAAGIFEPLEARVESFATVMYGTAAQELVTDVAGAVVGVRAVDADGKDVLVRANKGVVLSTGAFTYNDAMLSDNAAAALACGSKTGYENDLGDGITMGRKVGAATRSMSLINYSEFMYLYGDLACGVMLDYNGFRFLSEDWYGAWIGRKVIQHTPDACWIIVDDDVLAAVKETPYGAYLSPVFSCDTLDELLQSTGLPFEHAKESVERYNALCESGEDTDWHKDPVYLKPVAKAPFHALVTTPVMCSFHTLGGLKIDAKAQVIDLDGNPIPNLYAAGRTSCGIFGEYPGSGSSVADSLTFGRIAGQNAAQH